MEIAKPETDNSNEGRRRARESFGISIRKAKNDKLFKSRRLANIENLQRQSNEYNTPENKNKAENIFNFFQKL